MSEAPRGTPVDILERAASDERVAQLRYARQEAPGLLPYFRRLEGPAGPVVTMEGTSRIMLGSNNYLGLTSDPRVVATARAALDTYGTGVTGSRLLNGTLDLHLELEDELARWFGTEDAIVFTTGYQANVGAIATLTRAGDAVICDAADHASIVDGVTMSGARMTPYRHGRIDRLEAALGRASKHGGGMLVVVDGVFSMEGDVADLPAIVELCASRGAHLLVDEAHAVGVLGATGTGAAELHGVSDAVTLRMGTFSKSLASCGGFIAGPADAIDLLRVQARTFVFTAAAVPAAVGAALGAVRICRSDEGPERFRAVLENARYLHEGLRARGVPVADPSRAADGSEILTPIVAIRIGDDLRAATAWRALFEAGVYVNTAFHPAVPRGGALLRASVMATHETHHLDRAIDAIASVLDREGASEPAPAPATAAPAAGNGAVADVA